MVSIEDLKRINMLRDFPPHLLEVIAKEADLTIFGTGTRLATINEKMNAFYMLIMGQVAMKKTLTPEIDIIFEYIQSGSSFGSSALIEGATSRYTIICQEPCEVISLSGERMMQLFNENHELAYYMMLGIARQYKKNMDIRAKMIMKTLDENPELRDDIRDIENLALVI
jgi:signal-transduction protein with cAMP-binding, CBS, and nucleotidyltransferase domain